MTARAKIAITVAVALALAITNYGKAMTVTDFGLRGDLWDWGALAATVLAVIGVSLVDRWWALLPAAVPTAVTFYLYSFTGYSTSWDSEGLVFPSQPLLYAAVLLFGVGIQAVVLSIGFLPRRIWGAADHMWQRRHGR